MIVNFDNPAITLAVNASLVYGVAYAGRSYLLVNPLHAALFSLGTLIATELGKQLFVRLIDEKTNPPSFLKRLTIFISQYSTASLMIAAKVFSPLQAIIALGLTSLCTSSYYTLTGSHPCNLKLQEIKTLLT